MSDTKKRVVVTGLGVISPIGKSIEEYTRSIREGKNGSGRVTRFPIEPYKKQYACEIKDFPTTRDEPGLTSQYALTAAADAIKDSGINLDTIDPFRVGVSIGTSLGGIPKWMEYVKEGKKDLSKLMEVQSKVARDIALTYGFRGCNGTVATACASGTNSLGLAMDIIRQGTCDIMISGGSDPVTELSFSGFHSLMSMSDKDCSPFDKNRKGLILGEASAIMVLEELEHALQRNATIYAEVLGYGISNDAYHPTSPDPKGGGAIKAITTCLENSGISINDIDYINAHGTGTKHNDPMELKALTEVFGDRIKEIPVSSTKSMIGHTLGTAGSIEALTCILGMIHGFVPPTINLTKPMEGYEEINFVPGKEKPVKINTILSCSYAFAGNSAAIALRKYND